MTHVLSAAKVFTPRTKVPRLEVATIVAQETSTADVELRELFYHVRRSHLADIDSVNDEMLRVASAVDGFTALHVAVVSKSLPSLAALLSRSLPIDARDFQG
jgi:hypothetical protein